MQAALNIIGRTANERVFMFLLEQLCQCRLDKGRSRADEGDDPHPEYCARAADGNSRRYTCQIACAHTGSDRDGKSLERRDMLTLAASLLLLDLLSNGIYC